MTVQPTPEVWPECPTCGAAWALRRNLLNDEWVWTRDCKHKREPVLCNVSGRVSS